MTDTGLEQQVIATMLTDGDCLNDGLAELKAEDFSDKFHPYVFEAMNSMWQKEQPVNAITVYEEIKSIAKGRGTSWMSLKERLLA